MTAEAYIQDFQKERRPSTIRAAKLAVANFEQWRKGRPIDAALIREWRDSLRGKPGYRTLTVSHVRSYVSWLDDRELEAVPAKAVKELRAFKTEYKLPDTMSAEELRRMCVAAKEHGETGILAMLLTGARIGEVATMRRRDSGVVIRGIKTAREREFPAKLLGGAVTIFPAHHAHKLVATARQWRFLCGAAGLRRMQPKTARATVATFFASWKRLTVREVAYLLGHTVATAEAHYYAKPTFDDRDHADIPSLLGVGDLFPNP